MNEKERQEILQEQIEDARPLITSPLQYTTKMTVRKALGYKGSLLSYYVENLVNNPTKRYLITADVLISYYGEDDEPVDNLSFIIEGKERKDENLRTVRRNIFIQANPNLSENQLRALILQKLYEERDTDNMYTGDSAAFYIIGFSFTSYEVPLAIAFGNYGLFLEEPLKIKTLEEYSEPITYDDNCVYKYLCLELSKIYKTFSKRKLEKQMLDINYLFREEGFTINDFKRLMNTYYPNIRYLCIGSDYKTKFYKNECRNSKKSCLVFFVDNNHLYPITENNIKNKITRQKDNLSFLMTSEGNYDTFEMWEEDDELVEKTNYILPADININEFKNRLIDETGYCIEYFTEKLFKHPEKNLLIHANNEYDNRKATYETLNLGKWKNQGYPAIAKELLLSLGSIPSSFYNKESWNELSNYQPVAINDTIEINSFDNVGVDVCKHYTDIFYNFYPMLKTPIYDFHNCIKEYKGEDITLGEYYVREFTYGGVRLGGYYLHYKTIQLLLKHEVITKKDITKCINTKRWFVGKNFKVFVDKVKQFNEHTFKKLNNMLNGTLNNRYTIVNKENFHTQNLDTLAFLVNQSIEDGYSFKHEIHEDNYFIYRNKKVPNYNNTSSFYRQTLSISLFIMIGYIQKYEKHGIVKVKTDCLYLKNKNVEFDVVEGHYINKVGKIKKENSIDIEEVKRYEAKEYIEYKKEDNIHLILGSGGLGKSYKVIQEADEKKNILFITPTNASKYNLIDKAKNIKNNLDNWNFMTDSFFLESNRGFSKAIIKLNKYDSIIVDEVFMMSSNMLRLLVVLDTKVILLGDEKQLPKFEEYQVENYSLLDAKSLFTLSKKKFEEGKSRYSKTTYDIINEFVKTNKIPKTIKVKKVYRNEIDDSKFHLVVYNKTRKKLTRIITKNKFNIPFTFVYQKNEEKYNIGEGCKIICTSNKYKGEGIFNNWTGEIKKMNKESITIEGRMGKEYKQGTFTLDKNLFKFNFIPFYVSTIHKVQGCTIDKPYIIWDSYSVLCDKHSMYTSLTRCKNIDDITIEGVRNDKIYNYKPIIKKPINLIIQKKNYHIYELEWKCKCKHDKYAYYTHPIQEKKNGNCSLKKYTLLKNDMMDIHAVKRYICNYKKEATIELKNLKTKTFNPVLKREKKKIMIYDNYVMYIYYEDNERKRKKIRTVKITAEEALEKIGEPDADIVDKRE